MPEPSSAFSIMQYADVDEQTLSQVSAVFNRKPTMVAYIRYSGELRNAGAQLIRIQEYCTRHGFRLLKAFEEKNSSSTGLYRALIALKDMDGFITVDLKHLAEEAGDRMRDLKILMRRYFASANKRLITIEEGIDTSTAAGQMSVKSFID